MDAFREFEAAVRANTGVDIEAVDDGKYHRVDELDKPRGNKNVWHIFSTQPHAVGTYGNWRTGEKHVWTPEKPEGASPEDRRRAAEMVAAARKVQERERKEAASQAAATALDMIRQSKPADPDNPYLVSKHIGPGVLRQQGQTLLVPLRDISGRLVNLQRIFPDGTKRFLKGGQVKVAFCLLGEIPESGRLFICEGYATAASIHESLGHPVIAAMNAGNLLPVARDIRQATHGLDITIAADNDHLTEGNPGIEKGRAAAKSIGAGLTWPTLCGKPDCRCTDFNDTHNCPEVSSDRS